MNEKIRELVLDIDNLNSKILDYDKDTQEKIIECASKMFEEIDFKEFLYYEFKGEDYQKIISKYY